MVSATTSREEDCDYSANENNNSRLINYARRTSPCSLFSILGLATFCLICGLIICFFWHQLFVKEVAKKLPLVNRSDSQTTKLWSSQRVPQYLKVYMFNWTNSRESLDGSAIPHFTECGPYVFRARVYKENITWNNNYTVSYLQRRRWDFIPEMSNGSLSDQVTSINVVAVALAYQLKHMPQFILEILNRAINIRRVPLIITDTVHSQLFQGYDDGILSVLKTVSDIIIHHDVLKTIVDWKEFISDMKSLIPFVNKTPSKDTVSLPSQIIDKLQKLDNIKDKFGWWYQKNLTETHRFNIHTGEDDINKLGQIHSWDYKTFCRDNEKMRGSLGDLWPLNTPKGKLARIFIPDMCSSFDLVNAGLTEVNGIQGIKFVGTRETLLPPMMKRYRNCFDEEHLTGVRNITNIVKAPIFVSFPHFYQASELYQESISGMKPDKEKHEFRLVLQKDAGVVLQGSGRIQINVMLESSSNIDLVSKVPNVLFPTIWFEQTGIIPPDTVSQMQFAFITVPRIFVGAATGCLILGIMLLVSGLVLVHLLFKSEPYKKVLNYFNFFVFKSDKITISVQTPGKEK